MHSTPWNDYLATLNESTEMALATREGQDVDVRVVNFLFFPETPDRIYFASDRENEKVKQMLAYPRVAFTTIPREGHAHVRVKGGRVMKSEKSIWQMQSAFESKIDGYDETIASIGDVLDVFEIRYENVTVTNNFFGSNRLNVLAAQTEAKK